MKRLLVASFLILFLESCGFKEDSQLLAHPQVWNTGAGVFFEVHFPEYWHESDRDKLPMSGPGIYQIRTHTEKVSGPFLVRMESYRGNTSANTFSVTLDSIVKVQAITLSQWSSGATQSLSRGLVVAYSSSQSFPVEVEYKGRRYPKSGQFWGGKIAQISPDGRWLAVTSYTGEGDYRSSILSGGDAKLPAKGSIYLDMYDVQQSNANRKAIAQIKYTYKDHSPIIPDTLWLGSKYLVLPINYSFYRLPFLGSA